MTCCTEAQEKGEEEQKTEDECVEADELEAHDAKTKTNAAKKEKSDKAEQTETKQQAKAVQESTKDDKTKGTYKDRFFAHVYMYIQDYIYIYICLFLCQDRGPLLKPDEPLPLSVQHAVANCAKELKKVGRPENDGAAIMKACGCL